VAAQVHPLFTFTDPRASRPSPVSEPAERRSGCAVGGWIAESWWQRKPIAVKATSLWNQTSLAGDIIASWREKGSFPNAPANAGKESRQMRDLLLARCPAGDRSAPGVRFPIPVTLDCPFDAETFVRYSS
jgi:hypothetical protein